MAKSKTTHTAPKDPYPVAVTARRPSFTWWQRVVMVAAALVVAATAAGGVWLYMAGRSQYYIDKGNYQALFLASGQVYFGRLQVLGDESYRLTEVYYPQSQTTASLQGASTSDAQAGQPSPQLMKFGGELLGPQDEIIFPAAQVQYWVNLKADSKVSQAINAYRSK